MSWTVDWGVVATADVRRILPKPAARVCAAVLPFAESGRGPVERVRPYDPSVLRLTVPGAVALLRLDFDAGIMHVERLYPRSQ